MDDVTARYATVAAALAGYADLDDAVEALLATPVSAPRRGVLAAALMERVIQGARQSPERAARSLAALLTAAEAGPPEGERWENLRTGARMMVDTVEAAANRDTDSLRRLSRQIRAKITAGGRTEPAVTALVEVMDALEPLVNTEPGDPALTERLDDLTALVARLPAGDPVRAAFEESLPLLTMTARGGDPQTLMNDAGPDPHDRALRATAVTLHALWSEPDPVRIDEAIDRMRTAVAQPGLQPGERAGHLVGLAVALCRRAELVNRVDELPEAEALAVEARDLVDGPHDVVWSLAHDVMAYVHHRMPTRPGRHRTGVDGMRSHLWRVLLHPDPVAATQITRDAAREAAEKAVVCLTSDDPAAAVRALEAGRGLALYAATALRDVADRLTELGHTELAARWRAAATSVDPDDVPLALRREVVDALVAAAPAGALFDPPEPAQIGAALTELDADALIYLLPATDGVPGFALAVAGTGTLTYFALPSLRLGEHDPETEALSRLARRDAAIDRGRPNRDLGARDSAELEESLDTLCDWAWRAAMGKIIELYLPRLAPPEHRRTAHIVLIPWGELARVPWSAARRAGGRPAVHHVGISQAASARMLCHTATRAPVPRSRLGLVVGDPATTWPALPGARLEAYAIHQTFYRGGRYLGRMPGAGVSPSGAGDADQVSAWLTRSDPAAGTTLHLACHAVADVDRGRSYVLLQDGAELAADRLIELLAREPDRAIGLVVLAACNTGRAITGYDEAYSLGTALLAAGVRSVLSTQWSVPDDATSALMFMFHHGLMVDGLPPWQALRAAQLWMLDPGRTAPAAMPPELLRRLRDADPAGLAGWAGFVHWGR